MVLRTDNLQAIFSRNKLTSHRDIRLTSLNREPQRDEGMMVIFQRERIERTHISSILCDILSINLNIDTCCQERSNMALSGKSGNCSTTTTSIAILPVHEISPLHRGPVFFWSLQSPISKQVICWASASSVFARTINYKGSMDHPEITHHFHELHKPET